MKNCQLLILFLLMGMAGSLQGQTVLQKNVKLTIRSGTVGELLTALGSTEGITLSYSSGMISLARRVMLSGKELTVEDHLKSILAGQPLRFFEKENKIFIVFDESSPVKKKATISGYVTDNRSGERLTGASVYNPLTREGTTSNTYGFFSLTLDRDTVSLSISHAGYLPHEVQLFLEKDTIIMPVLEQHVVINEIVVLNTEAKKDAANRTIPGKVVMPVSMIKSLPALMGEADVLKSLQLLPGVQAGNEGTNGLNVRGGSMDQNLVLLDGIPVYNASHAFGLFSIFNADAVHNVELLKGGFPASYGGRLSSVVDVQLRGG
jgi:TonB-dependent Receptor Plug Domain/CarboxypepD_reg-like domain